MRGNLSSARLGSASWLFLWVSVLFLFRLSAVTASIRISGSVNFRFGPEHSDLLINVGQNRQLVIVQES